MIESPAVRLTVIELLWQLADDDLIIGFRDQEWLGLAPHIEEDVAFGSIAQEEIGHATYYFRLLEALRVGSADDLAILRPAGDRRNSVLLEQPNGQGTYLEKPQYDWSWTILRHYLHDVWEGLVLLALTASREVRLADAAHKILGEKRYHRAHQELWLRTIAEHDEGNHLESAMRQASLWSGDLPSFGEITTDLQTHGIVPQASALSSQFEEVVGEFLKNLGLNFSIRPMRLDGRRREHSSALEEALAVMSEVYRLDPHAHW